jgi:hypothetical protein
MQNPQEVAYLLAGLRDADIFEAIDYFIRIGRHLRKKVYDAKMRSDSFRVRLTIKMRQADIIRE